MTTIASPLTAIGGSNRPSVRGGRSRRIKEWLWRYLPCEIVGTVAELGGGLVVFFWTGSFAAAATMAAVCSSIGYYGIAYVNAVRWSHRDLQSPNKLRRFVTANGLAARSVLVEFGPAEAVDLFLARPGAFYLAMILTDNAVLGLVIGKILADIAFYACTIASCLRFRRLVVSRTPQSEEVVSAGAVGARCAA